MAMTEHKREKASKPDDKAGGDPKDVATTKPRGTYPQDQQFVTERQFPEEQPPVAPPQVGRPNSDPLSVPIDNTPPASEYGQPGEQNVPGRVHVETQRDKDEKR